MPATRCAKELWLRFALVDKQVPYHRGVDNWCITKYLEGKGIQILSDWPPAGVRGADGSSAHYVLSICMEKTYEQHSAMLIRDRLTGALQSEAADPHQDGGACG